MVEVTLDTPEESPQPTRGGWRPGWLPLLFRPKQLFEQAAGATPSWLTPILVLMLAALIYTSASGLLRMNQPVGELPPDFEYMPPEMQQQYFQAQALASGPVFAIVFPVIIRLMGLWVSWLLLGGLLHLTLTLLGGRGEAPITLSLVAWALLPWALRDLLRAIAVTVSRSPIDAPGLSGFIGTDAGALLTLIGQMLAQVDVFTIWVAVLLILAVSALGGSLSRGKRLAASLGVFGLYLLILSLVGFAGLQLSQLGGAGGIF